MPCVFGTESEALECFESAMRDEWEDHGESPARSSADCELDHSVCDDFPNNPKDANRIMADMDESWGRYDIFSEEIDIPDPQDVERRQI
jgi:hypothetical protein